jgi:phosphoribosylglycinamide formyltransferase 1
MSEKIVIAILVSGDGSNLQAIIESCQAKTLPCDIAVVISNRPRVRALERAEAAGIKTVCIPHQDYATRADFEEALLSALAPFSPAWIVLAGFDRILSSKFLHTYHQRVLNIHPALLPAFPGLHAARQVLDYGAKVTGVTVHIVDEGTDTGPIILQESVVIANNETEESLLKKLHEIEHRIYPEAMKRVLTKGFEIDGRTVRIIGDE